MFFFFLWDLSLFISNIFNEFFYIIEYFIFIFFLVILIFSLSFLLAPRELTIEKASSYECGFEPFGDARILFDIHFYLVGLLFLIFDLEIVFLFPWIFSLYKGSFVLLFNLPSFVALLFFLGLLTLGFVFEWRRNALTWVLKK